MIRSTNIFISVIFAPGCWAFAGGRLSFKARRSICKSCSSFTFLVLGTFAHICLPLWLFYQCSTGWCSSYSSRSTSSNGRRHLRARFLDRLQAIIFLCSLFAPFARAIRRTVFLITFHCIFPSDERANSSGIFAPEFCLVTLSTEYLFSLSFLSIRRSLYILSLDWARWAGPDVDCSGAVVGLALNSRGWRC